MPRGHAPAKNGILLNSNLHNVSNPTEVTGVCVQSDSLRNRLGIGGVVTLFIIAFTLLGIGSIASAEPAQQAATATAVPATAAATAVPCVNTGQGVQIVLGNPQPGDTLLTGVPVNMAGIAFDPASTSGSGITSVTVYLGDRDAGGLSLGTALLGQPNPQAAAGSQFATAGFTLRTPALPSGSGGRTIFVYARSAITNIEAILQVPIFLNVAPTPVKGQVPTAVLPPPPACTPTPVPAPTAAPTAVAPPVAPVIVATATPVRPPDTRPDPGARGAGRGCATRRGPEPASSGRARGSGCAGRGSGHRATRRRHPDRVRPGARDGWGPGPRWRSRLATPPAAGRR